MHWPAGRAPSHVSRRPAVQEAGKHLRQLHRAPTTLFSVAAFSHVQFRALCLPHEQVALEAQRQDSPERPQQVDGRVGAIVDCGECESGKDMIFLNYGLLVWWY